jgi:hypothetical protein
MLTGVLANGWLLASRTTAEKLTTWGMLLCPEASLKEIAKQQQVMKKI